MGKKWIVPGLAVVMVMAAFIVFAQPDINSVNDTPDPVEVPGSNNITADLTNANEAYVEIYYPDATLRGNYSMTFNPYGDWYYEGSYSYPDQLGTYTYVVTTRNATGWNTSATYDFTLEDTTPPSSSVSSFSPYWYNGNVGLTATASDNYAVANVTLEYRYSTNNATWSAWTSYAIDETSPWGWTFNFPDGQGYYQFRSIARDTTDNAEPSASADERAGFDTQSPSIASAQASPETQAAGGYVNISCESSDSLSGIDALYVEITYPDCSTGNFTMQYCPCTYFYRNATYSDVGTYRYTIYAVDNAGNGVTTIQRQFNITSAGDTTPPETTATLNPPSPDGPGGWYVSPVQVTLSATDDDSGVDYTMYRINNGTWTTYSSSFIVSDNGHYQVDFYSADNAGNDEAVDNVNFKINISVPTTVATFNPSTPDGANGWYLGTVEVTLTASDPDGINYTKYRVGNTAWQTYTGPFNVSTDGINVVEFYSVDNEGNVEDTKSTTVKIDTEAPAVSLLRPQFGYLYLFDRQLIPLSGGRTVSFGRLTVVASALDDASGIGNVTFYVNDEAQNIDLQSPYQWVWSSDIGTRALHVVAADRAGHTATSGTIIVSIFSF